MFLKKSVEVGRCVIYKKYRDICQPYNYNIKSIPRERGKSFDINSSHHSLPIDLMS